MVTIIQVVLCINVSSLRTDPELLDCFHVVVLYSQTILISQTLNKIKRLVAVSFKYASAIKCSYVEGTFGGGHKGRNDFSLLPHKFCTTDLK